MLCLEISLLLYRFIGAQRIMVLEHGVLAGVD